MSWPSCLLLRVVEVHLSPLPLTQAKILSSLQHQLYSGRDGLKVPPSSNVSRAVATFTMKYSG